MATLWKRLKATFSFFLIRFQGDNEFKGFLFVRIMLELEVKCCKSTYKKGSSIANPVF